MTSFVHCRGCGRQLHETAVTCPECGAPQFAVAPVAESPRLTPPDTATQEADTIRQIADYEKVASILWMVLGILQVLTVVAVIAGLINIAGSWIQLKNLKRIRARDATIPAEYENLTWLIVVGVINLLAGGAIGLLILAFDLMIRQKVLSNRALFTETLP